jgi:hypothetical protein
VAISCGEGDPEMKIPETTGRSAEGHPQKIIITNRKLKEGKIFTTTKG